MKRNAWDENRRDFSVKIVHYIRIRKTHFVENFLKLDSSCKM